MENWRKVSQNYHKILPVSVAQMDARSTGDQEVAGSTPAGSATFFRGDLIMKYFYSHFLPSADSRGAVVSFWRKNVHNTSYPLRGLSLPSESVVR